MSSSTVSAPEAPGLAPGRSLTFDLLKIAGLAGVILAHVDPPRALWLARNFDVPLLVLVAGAVFQLGWRGRAGGYGAYVRKRTVRLLAPTYLFLGCYFAALELLAPGRFDLTVMARTFLLLDGMGYVWVIRVFLFVALLAPLLVWWRRRGGTALFFSSLAVVYAVHEVLWTRFEAVDPFAGAEAIEFSFFYLLPYGCIFALGLRWPTMTRREVTAWAVGSLALCAVLMSALGDAGEPVASSGYKYPPRLIYIWYGLGMSHLLYALCMGVKSLPESLERAIVFVSASSLWIYLWHIPALQIARKLIAPLPLGALQFAVMWLFTAGFAVAATWVQKEGIGRLVRRLEGVSRTGRVLDLVFLR